VKFTPRFQVRFIPSPHLMRVPVFIFPSYTVGIYGPVVDSASNRNEYQEHFLGVKAAGA